MIEEIHIIMEESTLKNTPLPNDRLKRERNLRGWSFKDIADRIGCPDVRLVRRWEHGDVFPGPEYRQKLCQLFEKNAEELGLLKELYAKGPKEPQQKDTLQPPSEETLVPDALPAVISTSNELNSSLPHATRQIAQRSTPDTNRQRMLERVRHFWIHGLLEQSLGDAALIALGLYEDPSLVENPWRHVVQEAGVPSSALPPATSITQVYDASNGALLILGEPGAGKTTLLLELTRTLIERASSDEGHPIPVVFNLSSWAIKQPPLAQWLIEELTARYQVPHRVGQEWIEQDKLLLLLDGLDEVSTTAQEACVNAINSYRKAHGLVSLALCCRKEEYLSQKTRLLLQSAIVVQPLTPQQIDTYLQSGGEKHARLREVLAHDAELQDLVKTPLMLSILILTSQGEHAEDLILQGTFEEKREHLFHTYVQRMLQRRTSHKVYTQEQTLLWLSWLAKQMKCRSQTVFHIETLQFSDLPQKRSQLIPTCAFGLIAASVCWISYGLLYQEQHFHSPWIQSSIVGLVALFGFIILNGFIRTKISWFDGDLTDVPGRSYRLKRMQRLIVYTVCQSSLVSFAVVFIGWHMFGPNYTAHAISNIIILAAETMLLGIFPKTIQPIEILVFSWQQVRQRLIYYIAGGLATGLLLWLFFLTEFDPLRAGLLGLSLGLVSFCLFIGAVGLVSPKIMDTQYRLLPNEGIHRSIRNSLTLGIVSACLQGVLFGLIYGSFGKQDMALVAFGIVPGIGAFHVITTRTGGYAWVQHYLLRLCLWRVGIAPWNYPLFLDYAAERILLRRVGGGYIFTHHFLLDYFANLDISAYRSIRNQPVLYSAEKRY